MDLKAITDRAYADSRRRTCLNCKAPVLWGRFCADCVRGWSLGVGTALIITFLRRYL